MNLNARKTLLAASLAILAMSPLARTWFESRANAAGFAPLNNLRESGAGEVISVTKQV